MVKAPEGGLAEPFGSDGSGIDVEVDEVAGDGFDERGGPAHVDDGRRVASMALRRSSAPMRPDRWAGWEVRVR